MLPLKDTDISRHRQPNITIDERSPLRTGGVYYCCWDFYNDINAIDEKDMVTVYR